MKRKIIFAMLLICISLTACKTEKTVTDESTNTVVEEQDEESITVSENDPSIELFNSSQGTVDGYEVKEVVDNTAGGSMTGDGPEITDERKQEIQGIQDFDKTLNDNEVAEVEIVEQLDKYMYGIKAGNIREKDTTASDIIAELEKGAKLHVTGKTSNGWYQVDWGDGKAYVADSLLSDTDPYATSESKTNGTGITNTSGIPQEVLDSIGVNSKEIPIVGSVTDPNTQGGLKYLGGTEPW